jgi:hypothetical protein
MARCIPEMRSDCAVQAFAKQTEMNSDGLKPIWKASAAGLLGQLGPLTAERHYVVALDVSGGMPVRHILGVTKFIFQYITEKVGQHALMSVMQFDADVRSVQRIGSPEQAVRIQLQGGGGTLIRPVSDYMIGAKEPITAICVTDGFIGDIHDHYWSGAPFQGGSDRPPPLRSIGKPEDRFGWFLISRFGQSTLPGPVVIADDDRWALFGDGPRLFTEEENECA